MDACIKLGEEHAALGLGNHESLPITALTLHCGWNWQITKPQTYLDNFLSRACYQSSQPTNYSL